VRSVRRKRHALSLSHTHTHTHTQVPGGLDARIYIYIYIHIDARSYHIYMYTYIHIHTGNWWPRCAVIPAEPAGVRSNTNGTRRLCVSGTRGCTSAGSRLPPRSPCMCGSALAPCGNTSSAASALCLNLGWREHILYGENISYIENIDCHVHFALLLERGEEEVLEESKRRGKEEDTCHMRRRIYVI